MSLLSDCGKARGTSWAESRMASLAGQFAGIFRFEVDAANAESLAAALTALETMGLRVVIGEGKGTPKSTDSRMLRLELVGHDRPGIVRDISRVLADCGVRIDELHTEIVSGAMSGGNLFQVKAQLQVPLALPTGELRRLLEALANELMVDIALDDSAPRSPASP